MRFLSPQAKFLDLHTTLELDFDVHDTQSTTTISRSTSSDETMSAISAEVWEFLLALDRDLGHFQCVISHLNLQAALHGSFHTLSNDCI